jgi:hypothetical protein
MTPDQLLSLSNQTDIIPQPHPFLIYSLVFYRCKLLNILFIAFTIIELLYPQLGSHMHKWIYPI